MRGELQMQLVMDKSDHWERNCDQIDTRDYGNVILEAVDLGSRRDCLCCIRELRLQRFREH